MMRLLALLVAAGLLSGGPVAAQTLPDHTLFTALLERHVRDGLVDYAALKAERTQLDLYLEQLGRTSPRALDLAARDTRLAFWINAYNACALKLVLDHYPIERRGGLGGLVSKVAGVPANSIRQIPNTWDGTFCRVAQELRSLDGIEHGIIRPLGDPRIHFAVNCASRSCPELTPTAYVADSLSPQLDEAVQRFLGNPHHYRLETDGDTTLYLNKVLDWYGEDFGGPAGVLEFLARYVGAADAAVLRSGNVRVEFVEYDWTLNDTAVFGASPS